MIEPQSYLPNQRMLSIAPHWTNKKPQTHQLEDQKLGTLYPPAPSSPSPSQASSRVRQIHRTSSLGVKTIFGSFEPVPWDVRGRGKERQGNETGKGWLFIEIRISDTGNAQCWIWQSGLGTGSFSSAPSHSRLTHYQTMLSTVLGFSAFGFAARVGQLAIQKRPLFSSEPSRDLLVTTWN